MKRSAFVPLATLAVVASCADGLDDRTPRPDRWTIAHEALALGGVYGVFPPPHFDQLDSMLASAWEALPHYAPRSHEATKE